MGGFKTCMRHVCLSALSFVVLGGRGLAVFPILSPNPCYSPKYVIMPKKRECIFYIL
jgi:hypothetical protein